MKIYHVGGIFLRLGRDSKSPLEKLLVVRKSPLEKLLVVCKSPLKTVLKHSDKYHVSSAIKLGDHNVERKGNILLLPHYMVFLLTAY